MKNIGSLLIVWLILCVSILAQTKRQPRQKRAPKTTTTQTVNSEPSAIQTNETVWPANIPAKKNERSENSKPIESTENNDPQKKNAQASGVDKANNVAGRMPFNYEFSQPKFYITRIIIEHDAAGKGKITFYKQDLSDSLTDPLTISTISLAKIQNLWTTLNLIESNENYQSPERNYAHLGTMKLRRSIGDKMREVEFNWTENQTAKELTDEYKKLTEQYVWMFDMSVARENQPLNAPQLVDRLDSLLNRNQISDPKQMLVYLREVADDERIPLLARNHATKIIGRIEKLKEENK